MEFEDVARKDELAWKQRSRIQWVKQGDKNTRFFHRIATSHKRFNYIDQLEVDGAVTKDQALIKEAVHIYYNNLYKEAEQWRPELTLLEAT